MAAWCHAMQVYCYKGCPWWATCKWPGKEKESINVPFSFLYKEKE